MIKSTECSYRPQKSILFSSSSSSTCTQCSRRMIHYTRPSLLPSSTTTGQQSSNAASASASSASTSSASSPSSFLKKVLRPSIRTNIINAAFLSAFVFSVVTVSFNVCPALDHNTNNNNNQIEQGPDQRRQQEGPNREQHFAMSKHNHNWIEEHRPYPTWNWKASVARIVHPFMDHDKPKE